VATLHIDAEGYGGSEVEAAEDEFEDDAGSEGDIEQEQGSERWARVAGKKADEEGEEQGDDCGLGSRKEQQKGDATDNCGVDTTGVPEKAESEEESAERCGEHGFHAVELITMKERGGEERDSDQGKDAQRAAQPVALGIGGDGPCDCDDGGE
jgi:hypothetical protein